MCTKALPGTEAVPKGAKPTEKELREVSAKLEEADLAVFRDEMKRVELEENCSKHYEENQRCYEEINTPSPYQSFRGVCPNCGYCPYCGRGGYHTYPWQPYPGPYWYGTGTVTDIVM